MRGIFASPSQAVLQHSPLCSVFPAWVPVLLTQREGVASVTNLLEGEGVEAVLDFLVKEKPDLLVIGLHRHTSHISRLWNTVFELAQDAPCSVLGVH